MVVVSHTRMGELVRMRRSGAVLGASECTTLDAFIASIHSSYISSGEGFAVGQL